MSDRRLKVAIVGAGYTAREHARAFKDVAGVLVAAIATRTRRRAEALAAELGIPAVYDSIHELYERTRADLVIVAVSELSTPEVTDTCFEFPWTVLIEKPPGINLSVALKIRRHAAASGRSVYVGLNRRFLSSTMELQRGLASDAAVRYIKVQDQQNQEQAERDGDPPEVVSNWMYANAVHTIDYLSLFGRGPVTSVDHVIPWDPSRPGIVLARIAFESGDVGVYEGVWHAPGPWAVSVTIPGQRWELRPLERIEHQVLGSAPVRFEPHRWDVDFKPGFRAQAAGAVAAVRGEPSGIPSLDEAIRTMHLVSAIFSNTAS